MSTVEVPSHLLFMKNLEHKTDQINSQPFLLL